MKVSELRARYIEFFEAHDHLKMPSSPLVPSDPGLLFTSAGMVQFKDFFTGRVVAPHRRVVTCQKCFRTTDIENVGKTAFHQTFFEMLGNFSFGDYFKKGAITLQWEFLTQVLEVDPSRLWVSIYLDDDEAYDVWRDIIGVPADRIVRLGEEHNWWGPVGDSGPCGPDSEIHYDTGIENGCGEPDCAGPACDCNRFSEMGNLVFMQFNREEDGTLTPLQQKSIDTGMGLERIAATIQGVETNFDTDVFAPITDAIESASPRTLRAEDHVYRNSIADHIRAIVFLLSEGVMPSNERRGYVLRRILRRAIRAGEMLELAPGAMATFVEPVIAAMGATYPEIADSRDLSERLIAREEETFRRTLREGERRIAKLVEQMVADGVSTIPGDAAFELNDTYGFPLEMTQEIAADRGLDVDLDGYQVALEGQRERSRANVDVDVSMKIAGDVVHAWERKPANEQPFVGYEVTEAESIVTGYDAERRIIALDKTPFYAEAGGQVTDVGVIENLSQPGRAVVNAVSRNAAGVYLHTVSVESGDFAEGDRCRLLIDVERRDRIRRNHTATHLLHAGLRSVLGSHVAQAGSLVNDRELRFDFSHFEKMTPEQIAAVEDFANAAVLADHQVTTELLSPEQATETGAIGLFEDEYRGKTEVRVVSVNGVSKELCGGTHVARSGQIGLIKIVSEESVAAGTRRIRAVTGDGVLRTLREEEAFRHRMHELLGDDPAVGVEHLKGEIETLQQQLDAYVAQQVDTLSAEIAERASEYGGVRLTSARVDLGADQLKRLADLVEEKTQPAVVLLAGDSGGRALVVCKVSKSVRNVRAGDVVRSMSKALGGGGGGAPTFAQGGGQDTAKIDEVLASGTEEVRQALG